MSAPPLEFGDAEDSGGPPPAPFMNINIKNININTNVIKNRNVPRPISCASPDADADTPGGASAESAHVMPCTSNANANTTVTCASASLDAISEDMGGGEGGRESYDPCGGGHDCINTDADRGGGGGPHHGDTITINKYTPVVNTCPTTGSDTVHAREGGSDEEWGAVSVDFPSRDDADATAPHANTVTVGRWLGRGAQGGVQLCGDAAGALFAGKTIKLMQPATAPGLGVDIVERERRRYAMVCNLPPHANVVRHLRFDCITTIDERRNVSEKSITLKMEYVEGCTVDDLHGQLRGDEEAARHIVRSIVGALVFLHRRGIMHGDIKGSNVMAGRDGVVKLTDFGTAVGLEMGGRDVFKNNGPIGTPGYMSPELSNMEVTHMSTQCDMYSLGCMLVAMLTGGQPKYAVSFGGGRPMDRFRYVRLIAEAGHGPDLPRMSHQCRDFVTKCLVQNPDRRMTAEEAFVHPFLSTRNAPGSDGPPMADPDAQPLDDVEVRVRIGKMVAAAAAAAAAADFNTNSIIASNTNSIITTTSTHTAPSTDSDEDE